ncbi:MAG TPA: mechanosensitive ion channel family protein [Gaiellaceae bacterium]|nr:mechanosensitive ion channel family protein [Gaiellaceae bacterium]
MDSNAVKALVTAAIWVAIVVIVRFALVRGYDRYERRLTERDPVVAARRRTTFGFLVRVAVALVVLIGAWSVLSIFTVTQEVARAFLASSAVLALIAGLALSTPLGNLGSGVLLAFSQPLRLGDRISVGEHTGVVVEMTLTYTALATDEGRRVFVPNQQLVSSTLVNRSVGDPRRIVSVQLPVRMSAPLADARRLAAEAAGGVPGAHEVEVEIGEVGEKTVWLSVSGYAPPGADMSRIASEIRERALAALGEAGLLPAA